MEKKQARRTGRKPKTDPADYKYNFRLNAQEKSRFEGINKSTGEVKPAGFDYRETKYRELAFGGIHVISPSLFRLMDDGQWDGKFSIIPFYLSACTKVHIQGYPLQGFRWFDIGKPETLAQAEEYYKQK